jgi:hypothetical protein
MFSSLLLLPHQCKGSEKNFCRSLGHGRMATKREQQRLTPTRAMAPWTCELSDRIDVQLPSLIRDHPPSPPLQRIQKELAPQFLSLTSRNCRKTSYQIMYFYHIEATMRYCILHRWCPVSFTYSRRCHYNQVKVVRQTKDTYCDKKAVERERAANNTRKLTTALISECRHCFYAARSGK